MKRACFVKFFGFADGVRFFISEAKFQETGPAGRVSIRDATACGRVARRHSNERLFSVSASTASVSSGGPPALPWTWVVLGILLSRLVH